MKNKENIITSIDRWLRDYERIVGEYVGDDDTLEGSAYNLLSSIRRRKSELL